MAREIELIGDKNPLPDLADEHSSMLLVRSSKDREKMIMSQYDSTYPKKDYRLRVNLIGGAEEKQDRNPKHTLIRELKEEIGFGGENFAPEKFIGDLRYEIINGLMYYGTFESFFLSYQDGLRRNYSSIDIVYVTNLNGNLFDQAADFLDQRKKLVLEGNLKMVTLDQLKEGDPLTAWDTGKIISDIYNVPIPNPDNVFCRRIKIREPQDYKTLRQFFPFK